MSTFISVGGYEASAMLNEPAFWLVPRSLPRLSHSPLSLSLHPSLSRPSLSPFHSAVLLASLLPRPSACREGDPTHHPRPSSSASQPLSSSPSVSRSTPSSFARSSPACTPSRALARSSLSRRVGHEGASIPRPSVLCTPRSLMGRVRSGQPEGKLIPRRSDGNAFLARPPPPATRSLSLSLSFPLSSRLPCHASPSLSLRPSLFLSRGKSRGKRRREARDLLGYP